MATDNYVIKSTNIWYKDQLMCDTEHTEAPQGAYYLTLIPERLAHTRPTLEDLEQRRLNESIEIEYYVDVLIQKIMKERK